MQGHREGGGIMGVSISCRECGQIAIYNYDRNHKQVSRIVDDHKTGDRRRHRIKVVRDPA
jgi:RNase P subunit RPR2